MDMKKYMTRGVQECIPFDLVVLMWQMYDRCKEEMESCDYFHVFQLKMLEGDVLNQEIIHKQEVPEYERTYVINIDHPITEKVYVIESKEEMESCDYFHVFQLKMLEGDVLNQEIIHKQEVPEYERTYVINIDHPITEKVYVIESKDYVTMLLANEY